MIFTTILDIKSELNKSKGIFSYIIKWKCIRDIKKSLDICLENKDIPCNFFYDFASFVYCTMDNENNLNNTKIKKITRYQLDNNDVYFYLIDIEFDKNTILHIKPTLKSTLIEIETYNSNTPTEQKSFVRSITESTNFKDEYGIRQLIKDYTIDYLKGVL